MFKNKVRRGKPVTISDVAYPTISAALNAVSAFITDPKLLGRPIPHQVKLISERLIEGWSDEQAFGLALPPEWAKKGYPHQIECDGKVYPSEKALAAAFSVPRKILHQRLHREEWPPEAAVGLEPPPDWKVLLKHVTGAIYLYRHRETGKGYVGLTIDQSRRAWQHLALARSGKARQGTLQYALRLFGAEAFEFKILEENIPGQSLPGRERHWIETLGTLKPRGFNQNRGGVFGSAGTPIEIAGETYLGFSRVAEAFRISVDSLASRLNRGSTIEEAVGLVDSPAWGKRAINIEVAGVSLNFPTATAACRYFGLNPNALYQIRWKTKIPLLALIHKTLMQKSLDQMAGCFDVPGGPRPRRLPSAAAQSN